MKSITALSFLLLLLINSPAMAYDFGSGSIDIPDGFIAAEVKNVRDQGAIHEFSKAHENSELSTTIKITVYDFGQKLKRVPEGMMLAAAENHLLDYLAGMRRHYDNYIYKKMKSITIDNTPTAHVEWTGIQQGKKMHGTVYSVMKGSHVITLDARDYEGLPYDNLIAAIKAMNAVKLK